MWIKKLQICNNNLEEMYLRNDFMQFLWICVKNCELRPPFDELPPFDQIQKLKHLLVSLHISLTFHAFGVVGGQTAITWSLELEH